MAQISLDNIKKIEKNRNTIHEKVHAAYTVFDAKIATPAPSARDLSTTFTH